MSELCHADGMIASLKERVRLLADNGSQSGGFRAGAKFTLPLLPVGERKVHLSGVKYQIR